MRVVSEQDFMLLQSLKKRSKHEQLEDRKIATLDQNIDIPDDVRHILYNDASRRLHKQSILDKNTPILTSSLPPGSDFNSRNLGLNSMLPPLAQPEPILKQPGATTSTSNLKQTPANSAPIDDRNEILQKVKNKKGPALLQLLEDANVTWNANNELLVQNKRVPGSNIVDILNALASGRNFMNTTGMQSISAALKNENIPNSLLNKSIQSTLRNISVNASPKNLRSNTKHVKRPQWEKI